jgi:hypothetical protein
VPDGQRVEVGLGQPGDVEVVGGGAGEHRDVVPGVAVAPR